MPRSIFTMLLCVLCFAGLGCGQSSPTKQFEGFVAKATAAIKADATLTKDHKVVSVDYDVKTTDSTVSPLTADVNCELINIPVYVREGIRVYDKPDILIAIVSDILEVDDSKARQLVAEARQLPPPVNDALFGYDNGRRKYHFGYVFQGGKWALKEATNEKGFPLIGMIEEAVKEPFTP